MLRPLIVAVALVVGIIAGVPSTAHAGRYTFVFTSGDEIEPIRRFPGDGLHLNVRDPYGIGVSEQVYPKLGYHYDRWGLFGLDLWRWGGGFVAYDGMMYVELDDEQVEAIGGASVPWRYHLPPGLLILLALIELAIVIRKKRQIRTMLVLGGVWFVVALVFYLKGLSVEFIIPTLLGLHHTVGSWLALRNAPPDESEESDETAASDEESDDREPPMEPPRQRGGGPRFEADPFRSPPKPPPLDVVKPQRPTTETPVVPDENAPPPKILS